MAYGPLERAGRGRERTALEVAPEVEDLPHAQREERAKGQEEEVADAVVGRFCGCMREDQRCPEGASGDGRCGV